MDDHKVLVEPACGATLSVIYDSDNINSLSEFKSVLVIVCGGIGVSIDLLNQYITQLH